MIQSILQLLTRYRHVNWALADQGMISGANFLTWILLARGLGIEEFGRFALAWLVVMFVDGLQHAAISVPMMSIGPKQETGDRPAYYGAIFMHQLTFAAAAAAIVYLAARASGALFPSWDLAPLALPLALMAMVGPTQDFLRRYFFTVGRQSAAFVIDGVRYLGQMVVLYWVLFEGAPERTDTALTLWCLASTGFVAIIAACPFVRQVRPSLRSWRPVLARQWRFGRWFVASSVMQWFSGNIFLIVSGGLLGPTVIGAIRAATSILGLLNPLILGLQNVVPIRASAAFQNGSAAGLIRYLKTAHHYAFAIVAVFAAVVIAFNASIMETIYGAEFKPFGFVLIWAAASALLQPLGLVLGSGIRATEKTSAFFVGNLCAILFTLALAYPLVRYLGIHGVMLGMLGAQVIQKSVWWWKLARLLRPAE